MLMFETHHFLTGEELSAKELTGLLDTAIRLKTERGESRLEPHLKGRTLALLFEKPSLRTRLSFSLAIQELGGFSVESVSSTRKDEAPEDIARVLNGYAHAVMVRTFEHAVLERMASVSRVPMINGLTDTHHPCQVLADLMTLKESFGKLEGLKLAYVGDGNNMLHSLSLLMPFLGVHLRYACPGGFEPDALIMKRAALRTQVGGGSIEAFASPVEAVTGADAVYTDVWTSMGFEEQTEDRRNLFAEFQVNESLYRKAKPTAVIMHCLPMAKGEEMSAEMVDHPNSIIFHQAENRLHAQKALLIGLVRGGACG